MGQFLRSSGDRVRYPQPRSSSGRLRKAQMTTASSWPAGRRGLNMIRAAKSSFGRGEMLKLFAALPLAIAGIQAGAEPIPVRTPIGSFAVAPAKAVSRVEMTRVDFLPGQEMPAHLHPVPVICVVSKGSFAAS